MMLYSNINYPTYHILPWIESNHKKVDLYHWITNNWTSTHISWALPGIYLLICFFLFFQWAVNSLRSWSIFPFKNYFKREIKHIYSINIIFILLYYAIIFITCQGSIYLPPPEETTSATSSIDKQYDILCVPSISLPWHLPGIMTILI